MKMAKLRRDVIGFQNGSFMLLMCRRRERHPLESVAIRRTRCAAAVALRPTTFRSRLVANVATLPSARESITGVPRLRGETLPGLVE